MATNDALKCNISEPILKPNTKCAILEHLWDVKNTPADSFYNQSQCDSYFSYYGKQCSNALATYGLHALLSTHQDIIDVILQLKDLNSTREAIKEGLLASHCHLPHLMEDSCERLICAAIDLAIRLWLMIDVGETLHCFTPGQKSLLWESGPLRDLIKAQFGPIANIKCTRIKLEKIFTARNLERIAGLRIVWTSNLADHLRLVHDYTSDDAGIKIFHHVSFLEHHRTSAIFPDGLIEETLYTLKLLLPQYDKKSCKWFRGQHMKYFLDGKASVCGHLTTEERQIENFVFWHDRLVILKQVFDEAEPSTIAQWWCDRRRRAQWYTFWVAAMVLGLTIFFGMIQCLEGGLQVYKAYYPS
jgi:hypothetical protein